MSILTRHRLSGSLRTTHGEMFSLWKTFNLITNILKRYKTYYSYEKINLTLFNHIINASVKLTKHIKPQNDFDFENLDTISSII